jgi:hypothetical protein
VTRDEVHNAVLAFLDQFIERGAAPDVLALRDRVAGDDLETRQSLDTFLPDAPSSAREGFDAMRALFSAEWERAGRKEYVSPPGLMLLISWTEPCGSSTEESPLATSDPAQWHDWLAAIEASKPT